MSDPIIYFEHTTQTLKVCAAGRGRGLITINFTIGMWPHLWVWKLECNKIMTRLQFFRFTNLQVFDIHTHTHTHTHTYIYIYIYIYTHTHTELLKNKFTISKFYFTKTTDVKSMSCVRMERKSLKVLISMIWSGASLRLWLLLPVTCCDECGKSWIIDLTSTASHVGLTSSACKVWK
jgi:hypothetical protein